STTSGDYTQPVDALPGTNVTATFLHHDVVIAGDYGGTLDLDGQPLENDHYADLFVARLGSQSSTWVRRGGDSNSQLGDDVAVGPHGDIAVAGHFSGALS